MKAEDLRSQVDEIRGKVNVSFASLMLLAFSCKPHGETVGQVQSEPSQGREEKARKRYEAVLVFLSNAAELQCKPKTAHTQVAKCFLETDFWGANHKFAGKVLNQGTAGGLVYACTGNINVKCSEDFLDAAVDLGWEYNAKVITKGGDYVFSRNRLIVVASGVKNANFKISGDVQVFMIKGQGNCDDRDRRDGGIGKCYVIGPESSPKERLPPPPSDDPAIKPNGSGEDDDKPPHRSPSSSTSHSGGDPGFNSNPATSCYGGVMGCYGL